MLFGALSWEYLIPKWLLPDSGDLIAQGQATLIVLLSLFMIVATLFLLLSWVISRDLQRNTVFVSFLYIGFLAWIMTMPRSGQIVLASYLLVIVLLATMIFMTVHYGVSSPSVSAFLIPIVLSTILLNTAVSFLVTAVSVMMIWGMAFVELKGWWIPLLPVRQDNLTFKAPLFTVLFTAVFLMISSWTNFLITNLG